MTTLYFAPGACSLAPHIVLEWIGAPYTAVKVAFGSPELLAVNPAGAVPTLQEDDGWLLTQAGAILEYLAAKHPEAKLGGGGSLRDNAELFRWSSFFTSDMHAAFWPVFSPQRYTTDDNRCGTCFGGSGKILGGLVGVGGIVFCEESDNAPACKSRKYRD